MKEIKKVGRGGRGSDLMAQGIIKQSARPSCGTWLCISAIGLGNTGITRLLCIFRYHDCEAGLAFPDNELLSEIPKR